MSGIEAARRFGTLAALFALLGAGCSRAPERPRNVLLLVVDTLRADRLHCYGYPRETSPNIDALAARGTLYERNYSQACWTIPSMISMLTGVSVTQEERACPPSIPLLAETLRQNGFETIAFPANAVLCTDSGFERGFMTWSDSPSVDALELGRRFALWHGARPDSPHASKPWFAWLQFIDPHHPYEPAPEFDRFRGPRPDHERLAARWRAAEAEARERSTYLDGRTLDQAVEYMTEQSNLYDGEVLQADAGIGLAIEALRAGGELENTLVIVVSDHGEMLFEHRSLPYLVQDRIEKTGGLPDGVADLFANGHRPWYFENLWNTPMILAGPGMPAGKRVKSLSANLDVFPTILEALDLRRGARLEGESLFGGRDTTREHVTAYGYFTSAILEREGLKLVEHPRRLYLLEGEGDGPRALYDLARDPFEEQSAAERRPADVERLHGEIEAWKQRSQRDARTTGNEAQERALQQMGYVDIK